MPLDSRHLRLIVNVDHVATLRNARGGFLPDPVRAAVVALTAGADGITAHLREDRRHMSDADMQRLRRMVEAPFTMEMAATREMVEIACSLKPDCCCLVPERREERTTEGGLMVGGPDSFLAETVATLAAAGIRVSLFVEPEPADIEAVRAVGASMVELHSGAYCRAAGSDQERELHRLRMAASFAASLGLECQVGHGLSDDTVGPLAAIPEISGLSIGHFLIGEALFVGLPQAVAGMRRRIDLARAGERTGK